MSSSFKRRRLNGPEIEQDLADRLSGPFLRPPISRQDLINKPIRHEYKNDRTHFAHLVDFLDRQEVQQGRTKDSLALNTQASKAVGKQLQTKAQGVTSLRTLKSQLALDQDELELPKQLKKSLNSGAAYKKLRWPAPLAEAPKPEWSFRQEVEAIVSKRYSVLLEQEKEVHKRQNKKRNGKLRSATLNEGQQSLEAQEAQLDEVLIDNLPQLVRLTLPAVGQQIQRVFEHMTLEMSKRSTDAGPASRAQTAEQDIASGNQAGSPVEEEPVKKQGRREDPRFPPILDWTSVIGSLAEWSRSTCTSDGMDKALDKALKASIERLVKVFGDTTLQPLQAKPKNLRAVARGSNIAERIAVIERVRRRTAASFVKPWDSISPHVDNDATSRRRHVSDAKLCVLDPAGLLVDQAGCDAMRPPPLAKQPETWPLPPDTDDDGTGAPLLAPSIRKGTQQHLQSNIGRILLAAPLPRTYEESKDADLVEVSSDDDDDSQGDSSGSADSEDDSDSDIHAPAPRTQHLPRKISKAPRLKRPLSGPASFAAPRQPLTSERRPSQERSLPAPTRAPEPAPRRPAPAQAAPTIVASTRAKLAGNKRSAGF